MIARVAQEHAWGCEIACAAMVLGVSYAAVVADLSDEQRALLVAGKPPDFELVNYLRSHGLTVTMHWPIAPVRVDPDWRLQPQAERSIFLTSPRGVIDPAGLHAIVVLRDGTVIDPNTTSPQPLDAHVVWCGVEIADAA